ncbi:MAG: RNA-binding S4 domain-containing protein [Pseudomonadota bacterium]
MRLDKWLWQARFFKTRTLATEMVARGKVRVNARPTRKPAATIGPGDTLTFVQGGTVRLIRVTALPDRRGPAPEAQACYEALDDLPPC